MPGIPENIFSISFLPLSNSPAIFFGNAFPEPSAPMHAYCERFPALDVIWLWKLSMVSAMSFLHARYPILYPVIAYAFDALFMVIVLEAISLSSDAMLQCFA